MHPPITHYDTNAKIIYSLNEDELQRDLEENPIESRSGKNDNTFID